MATANFYTINANSYYTILDTYEAENENGEMVEYTKDEWEYEEEMYSIRYNGKEQKSFPNPSNEWNRKLDARELCESDYNNWETFGNAWTTETNITSTIVLRSGYYSGAVLDYEIKIQTSQGDNFYLSDYDDIDDMIHDYLDTLKGIIEWKGYQHNWNVGTFKIQKKNIRKWIEKRLQDEKDKCEDFCKKNCEVELAVKAHFSNGETWYTKVA